MLQIRKFLSAVGLLTIVRTEFQKIKPPREASVGKKGISFADCLMSAFAMFNLKYASLLQFDNSHRQDPQVQHNLGTLYGIEQIPCDTYMRERLDEGEPPTLRKVYKRLFSFLQRGKALEPYRYLNGRYLLAGDGSIADVSNLNPSWADATGILISNFTDLRIWAREIKERKLLSDKMKAERYAWVNSDEPNISSGFGLDKIFDWVGHPGTIYGYNTEVYFNSEKKITVIIMANSIEGEPAGNILFSIMQILTPNNLGKFNKEADLHLKL